MLLHFRACLIATLEREHLTNDSTYLDVADVLITPTDSEGMLV